MLIILLLFSIGLIIFSTTKLNLHPFLALLLTAIIYGLASGMSLDLIVTSINEGFGGTLGKIGLVIILGVIIGAFLEHSGGAYKLAETVLKVIGEKRVPVAMAIIGYIVSIPVFADSGFIILSPLNKALTKKAKLSIAGTAIALGLGLMASHTLVPPTPGPIAAAGILNADLGLVIFWGVIVSILALIPGIIFAVKVASKTYIDPNPEITEEVLKARSADAPTALISFLPIFVPIMLIVFKSFNDYGKYFTEGVLFDMISFLGMPVIALLVGLAFALLLPKKLEKKMLSAEGWVGKALKDAAIIIMITGAGGVFGKVLQNSGIADVIGAALEGRSLGIWLPFIIAAAVKTAQGSSTVAMITTASIIAPMLITLGFNSDLSIAFCVLAIGTGSMVVSHANDSFFWVLTQMTGMDVSTGYRLHTLGTGIVGFSSILVIYILSMIFV
jgi:gluconate:H+ symporter, GntP family